MKKTFRKIAVVTLFLFSVATVSGCAAAQLTIIGIQGAGLLLHEISKLSAKKNQPITPPEEAVEQDVSGQTPVRGEK